MLKTYTPEPFEPKPNDTAATFVGSTTDSTLDGIADEQSTHTSKEPASLLDEHISTDSEAVGAETVQSQTDTPENNSNETSGLGDTSETTVPENAPEDTPQPLATEASADPADLAPADINEAVQLETHAVNSEPLDSEPTETDETKQLDQTQSNPTDLPATIENEDIEPEKVDTPALDSPFDLAEPMPVATESAELAEDTLASGLQREPEMDTGSQPPKDAMVDGGGLPDHEPTLAELEARFATTKVDTSTLFEKDDEPPFVVQSPNRPWFLRKKYAVIFLAMLVLLVSGSVLASINHSKSQKAPEVIATSPSDSYEFAVGDDSTLTTSVASTTTDPPKTEQNSPTPNTATTTTAIQPTTTPTKTTATATPPKPTATPTPVPAPTPKPTIVASKIYTINYTSSRCFSPSKLTIKPGDSVKFVNGSNQYMWPITGNHPTHALLPELNSRKNIAPGDSFQVTLNKLGTWSYHNEAKTKCGGSITVRS